MSLRPLVTALEGLVDAMLAPPESRVALLQERLPPPVAALLANDPPEPLPGRYLAAAPLKTQATDRLFKAALKDGNSLLVHVVFAQKISEGPRLESAVEAWKQAIIEQWLNQQPPEIRQSIIGIMPLIIKFG